MGMPQLSQLELVLMSVSSVRSCLIWLGTLDQRAHADDQRIGLSRRQPGNGLSEQVSAEHVAIPAQGLMTAGSQPYQRPPPVPRIVLALQQTIALEMGHDL